MDVQNANAIAALENVLCLETSGISGSVALSSSGIVYESILPSGCGSAQSIATALKELVSDRQLTFKQIDLVAVTQGPGSFTGLRVGLALTRALAFANGTRVLGISTLELLGQTYCDKLRNEKVKLANPAIETCINILAVINAFRNEAFIAGFRATESFGAISYCAADQRVLRNELPIFARRLFGGQPFQVVSPESKAFFPKELWAEELEPIQMLPSAASMLPIIARMRPEDRSMNVDLLLPNYLRGSAAEEKRASTSSNAAKS